MKRKFKPGDLFWFNENTEQQGFYIILREKKGDPQLMWCMDVLNGREYAVSRTEKYAHLISRSKG